VLPETLELPHDSDVRWNIPKLLRYGREAADAEQLESPTTEDFIRLGIREAARMSPLDPSELTVDEATSIVRLTLFDLGPTELAGDEVTERVTGRLLDAINAHLDNDTPDFCYWLFDKADNLVHQIAKKKKAGGPVDRELVRKILLETSFRAHRYVADCMDLAMRSFELSVPESLTADELVRFRALYRSRPELGNLPLIMLADRFDLVRECVVDVFQEPADPRRIGVLLKALWIVAEMTRIRRAADREYKRAGNLRSPTGKRAKVAPLSESEAVDDASDREIRRDRTVVLARKLGFDCECPDADHYDLRVHPPAKDARFEVTITCGRCERTSSLELTHVALEDLRSTLNASNEENSPSTEALDGRGNRQDT
jgi:hypothetical protein